MRDGFARCVDWSIALVSGGAEKLRAAEKAAKEKKMRIWKDYTPSAVHSVNINKFFYLLIFLVAYIFFASS